MQNPTTKRTPPPIAGLSWRPISAADLEAVSELARACHLADGGLAFMIQPGNLQNRYFPDAPGTAIGAFTPEGHLVACATVHRSRDADTQKARITGQVRPDWRRRGIGTYLLHWSQEAGRWLLAEATAGLHVLQIATESLTAPADHLYRARGFAPVFEELVMRHDLHPPLPDDALPSDVTLTSWQPDLAEQFFQAYDASFRDRPGFPGWSAAEWLAWIVDDDFRPEWSLLARVDGVPLGFLIGTAETPDGFVQQVGVAPVMRRRKLGSALMVEAMRRMKADGAASTQLTVNTNNPGAIQTYTRLGFATIGRRARYEQRETE
ncbi:MAG: GNAT family N-acetyltransferase [Chloroflexota bacterium]